MAVCIAPQGGVFPLLPTKHVAITPRFFDIWEPPIQIVAPLSSELIKYSHTVAPCTRRVYAQKGHILALINKI